VEQLAFPLVQPTEEAQAALLGWERAHEARLGADGDLVGLTSYGSKLASRLCRIAALFHAAEHRREPWAHPLTLDTMAAALTLAPYFIAHAQALAFDLEASPDAKLARKALDWIRRERRTTFSRRDLHRAIHRNGAARDLDAPLEDLRERFFIRPLHASDNDRDRAAGRPQGPVFEVNPRTHAEGRA
jgi:hypothetical protein